MQCAKSIFFFLIFIPLLFSCTPELVDEDGQLPVDTFSVTYLPDTIVEGNYTTPPCINTIDSNHVYFNYKGIEVDDVKVLEEINKNVEIHIEASNPYREVELYIILPSESIPNVRMDYELTSDNSPGKGQCYIYLKHGGFNGIKYDSFEGTLHFYRKENGGFRIHICDADFNKQGDNFIIKGSLMISE